jgi:hypothetical protein
MESMTAERKQSQDILWFERRQTNRAIAAGDFRGRGWSVFDGGEREERE